MRVIVLDDRRTTPIPRLDAQIRVGGDAGASEVIVLRAFGDAGSSNRRASSRACCCPTPRSWCGGRTRPPSPRRRPPIGRIAQRRITDAATKSDPRAWVASLGKNHAPGDTDLAWTRLTHWREQLAAVLDQPPYDPVTAVEVRGAASSPSTALLAAWLRLMLDVPVDWRYLPEDEWKDGIKSVRLARASGDVLLARSSPAIACLTQPGQPEHDLVLARRTLRECLAEELRRLDPDVLYGRVITEGWELLDPATQETHG